MQSVLSFERNHRERVRAAPLTLNPSPGDIEAFDASFPSKGIIVNEFACAETVDGQWSICDFEANNVFMADAVPALMNSSRVAR